MPRYTTPGGYPNPDPYADDGETEGRMGQTTDALRHKLIADLFDLPVWERGEDRVVTPPWGTLTVAERDLIADALRQWTESLTAR